MPKIGGGMCFIINIIRLSQAPLAPVLVGARVRGDGGTRIVKRQTAGKTKGKR